MLQKHSCVRNKSINNKNKSVYGIICNSPGFTLVFHMFTVDWVQSRHLLIVLRCEVQVLKALPFNRKTLIKTRILKINTASMITDPFPWSSSKPCTGLLDPARPHGTCVWSPLPGQSGLRCWQRYRFVGYRFHVPSLKPAETAHPPAARRSQSYVWCHCWSR